MIIMHWISFKNPPKQEYEEFESCLLKFAQFDGDKLVRIDDGYYDFKQKAFYYESDRYNVGHPIDVNCTHWVYGNEFWKMLEDIPKE